MVGSLRQHHVAGGLVRRDLAIFEYIGLGLIAVRLKTSVPAVGD